MTPNDFEKISLNAKQYKSLNVSKIINMFINQIFLEDEVTIESMGEIMEKSDNSINFDKAFVDNLIIKYHENPYIKIKNAKNIEHLGNILNTIILNIDSIENKHYDLNFEIIYIASKIYYEDKHDEIYCSEKIYLFSVLSKNKLYSTRKFWIELIESKINKNVNEEISNIESNTK